MERSGVTTGFYTVLFLLCGLWPVASPAQLVLSEVLFDPIGVDTGRQAVEIHNAGPDAASIGGYWLAFKPTSWQFPDGVMLAPGATIVVHVNQSGQDTDTDLYTGTSGLRNLRRDDSLSLFTQNVFSDPNKLVDFVEWGTAGQAGEDVAVEAQKWAAGAALGISTLREGSSISRSGEGPFAGAWCIDGTPSLGAPHDDCARSLARSPVRINELRPGPNSLVEMKNVGDVLEDLGGKWLVSKSSSFRFPPGTLVPPNGLLLVHLGATGTNGETEVYTGPFPDLLTSDSLVFASGSTPDATQIIDFLEWGSAGMPFETQAADASLWVAGVPIPVVELSTGGSVASEEQGAGSARWTVDNTPTFLAENTESPERTLIINEVLVSPPAGESVAVEIHNLRHEPFNLSGFLLCARGAADPVCAALPAGTMLGPGGLLVVRLGAGAPPAGEVGLPGLPPQDAAGGELALLVNLPSSSSNNYLDYLRWGGGAVVLENGAAAAGLWPQGETVDTAGIVPGSSIAHDADGPGAARYRLDESPSLGLPNAELPPQRDFVRSDCNQDGIIDLSDPINIFGFLFLGDSRPGCDDGCDANDDGGIDISDPVAMLGALFLGGTVPRPPITCGADPTGDDLSCASFSKCP